MQSLNEKMMEVLEKRRVYDKWLKHTLLLYEKNHKVQLRQQTAELLEGESFNLYEAGSSADQNSNGDQLFSRYTEAHLRELQKELMAEYTMYKDHLQQVETVESEEEQLAVMKESLIEDQQSFWSNELYEAAAKEIKTMGAIQNLTEAVDAGEQAYYSLEEVMKAFDKQADWTPAADYLEGAVPSFLKGIHVGNVLRAVHRADRHLRQFRDEIENLADHSADVDPSVFHDQDEDVFEMILRMWLLEKDPSNASLLPAELQDLVSSTVNRLKTDLMEKEKQKLKLSEERIRLLKEA
ncbi:hypothetical protein [Alkalicoccus luteus]|uniref:Uncharacterized protein n=1 Tax=Alkalicoccus luteus TaxID=1237094 RepID=A0A969TUT7_9BACI|nr:hypothetical protein [Alkalicoccus luteus]NJP37311.1 hypothetical protein [Alkalicoccus luteus]